MIKDEILKMENNGIVIIKNKMREQETSGYSLIVRLNKKLDRKKKKT